MITMPDNCIVSRMSNQVPSSQYIMIPGLELVLMAFEVHPQWLMLKNLGLFPRAMMATVTLLW